VKNLTLAREFRVDVKKILAVKPMKRLKLPKVAVPHHLAVQLLNYYPTTARYSRKLLREAANRSPVFGHVNFLHAHLQVSRNK